MDFISARLTQLSTQRAIRGFVALLVTSVTFWCLISGDDVLQNSSPHHSDGVNLAPRGTVKIQTPGAIAGLVVGTILGVLAIGVVAWLFCRANRLKLYHGSGSTKGDRPREHIRNYSVEAPKPRLKSLPPGTPGVVGGQEPNAFDRSHHVKSDLSYWTLTPPLGKSDRVWLSPSSDASSDAPDIQEVWSDYSPRGYDSEVGVAGPPMQFWKPTEMERDLASKISLDEGLFLAIPTPPKSSDYDPVVKPSSPDLESKILLPESLTPVLAFS
jgi:hypothetical protein